MNLKIRTYDPKLTIKENAEANNVNELAIKRYIKRNGIDRQGERLTTLLDGLIKAYKKDPTLTVYQFANATKKAPQTIKKYWPVITGEMTIEDFKKEYHLEDTKIAVSDFYNYYATHPSVTRDLLRVESFHNEILEPFCGGGFMSREIQAHGYNVTNYDIIDRGCNRVADFTTLEVEEWKFDIITNPPYINRKTKQNTADTVDHILKCIRICRGKVAVLLPLHYLTSKDRYTRLYVPFPPSRIYVYQNRIIIARNGDFDTYKDQGANLTMYAWFIWEKGYTGDTVLKWLYNVID